MLATYPASFDRPRDILESHDLLPDQKIKLLKEWEIDLRELQVASEEKHDRGRFVGYDRRVVAGMSAVPGEAPRDRWRQWRSPNQAGGHVRYLGTGGDLRGSDL
jgi:hypothetical protein